MSDSRYMGLIYVNIGLGAAIVAFAMGIYNTILHYQTHSAIAKKVDAKVDENKQVHIV